VRHEAEAEAVANRVTGLRDPGEAAPLAVPAVPEWGRAAAGLSGSGRPLSDADRSYFEPRLGRDLSAVRVHDEPAAARGAQAIGARAFALGSDIGFAPGEYAPGTPRGRWLMAHELAHVAQQTAPRTLGGPALTPSAPAIAMRGPLIARPVPRPPALRAPPRAGTGAAPTRGLADPAVPYHQRYAAPAPHDNSFEAMMWRASERAAQDRAVMEGEVPHATLRRGGRPPGFTTDTGRTQQAMIGSGATVTYRVFQFHILDAIEHDVARAETDDDLRRIVGEYMPDSLLARSLLLERLALQRAGRLPTPVAPMILQVLPRFHLPLNLDPRAEQRMQVFSAAVAQRTAAAPRLARGPLAQAVARNLMLAPPDPQDGACRERQVPRGGGNARHDAYALHVTGSTTDYEISTPEGITCSFDGLDPHGQLWEVKTGYRYFSEANIIWSPDVERFHDIILGLEEQRMRCTYVAARCSRPYAYAFDDGEVARFMQVQWGGVPPVFHIPPGP
jgi:hypothetical protein